MLHVSSMASVVFQSASKVPSRDGVPLVLSRCMMPYSLCISLGSTHKASQLQEDHPTDKDPDEYGEVPRNGRTNGPGRFGDEASDLASSVSTLAIRTVYVAEVELIEEVYER